MLGSARGAQAGFVEQVNEALTFPVEVEAGQGSITLSWEAHPGVQFYRIWCGLSADDLVLVADFVTDLSYTISGLAAGRQYFPQVTGVISPRQSLASVVDDGSGGDGASQGFGVIVLSVPPRLLAWDPDAITGAVTLQSDDELADSAAPASPTDTFNNFDFSLKPDITGLLAYAEILLQPPFTQSSNPNVGTKIGLQASTTNQQFGEFVSSDEFWSFSWQAANSSDSQVTTQPCAQVPTVFGALVDMPNRQFYMHINGQWWDTGTQAFVSTYQEATPLQFDEDEVPPYLMFFEFAGFF